MDVVIIPNHMEYYGNRYMIVVGVIGYMGFIYVKV